MRSGEALRRAGLGETLRRSGLSTVVHLSSGLTASTFRTRDPCCINSFDVVSFSVLGCLSPQLTLFRRPGENLPVRCCVNLFTGRIIDGLEGGGV